MYSFENFDLGTVKPRRTSWEKRSIIKISIENRFDDETREETTRKEIKANRQKPEFLILCRIKWLSVVYLEFISQHAVVFCLSPSPSIFHPKVWHLKQH